MFYELGAYIFNEYSTLDQGHIMTGSTFIQLIISISCRERLLGPLMIPENPDFERFSTVVDPVSIRKPVQESKNVIFYPDEAFAKTFQVPQAGSIPAVGVFL